MSKLFENLKAGLDEAVAHHQGKLRLRTILVNVPRPPSAYKAKDIKRIRKKHNYSQSSFAEILNVSLKTVQAWEAGERLPNHTALRLLELIEKNIYCPKIFTEE